MMRNLALILGILLMTSSAYAVDNTTDKGSHPVPGSSTHSTAIREHTHDIDDIDTDTNTQKGDELGMGVDLVVYDGSEVKGIDEVRVDYRYDIHNENHSTYGVVKINPWKLFR